MARRRPVMVTVIGTVIGTVLVLAGCAGSEPAESAAPPATPASEPTSTSPVDDAPASGTAPAEKPKPVPEKLRFTAKTLDGAEFSGASLAGKPAMLWFWAPWCTNCQAEAPTMAEASKSTGVQFVGVAAQDQVPAMQAFVQRFGLGDFPHLADTEAAVWKRFGVTYQPAYAFVSSNGDVEVETDILDKELLDRVAALR